MNKELLMDVNTVKLSPIQNINYDKVLKDFDVPKFINKVGSFNRKFEN